MPGRLFLTRATSEVAAALGVAAPERSDPPRVNIAPGQEVLCLRPGARLDWMRWGMVPVGRVNARGRPVMETIVNARSETVFQKSAFAGVGRCVVPAEGWYEWTGRARRKTAWQIRPAAGGLLYFAGIYDVWRAPNGVDVAQVATVTCPPSPDVAQVHDRMGVLLAPEAFETWLSGPPDALGPLMVPAPAGSLRVTKADGLDGSGP